MTYLKMQNRQLMLRLTAAEADIVALKKDYASLKTMVTSSESSTTTSDKINSLDTRITNDEQDITALDKTLNMMSLAMIDSDKIRGQDGDTTDNSALAQATSTLMVR